MNQWQRTLRKSLRFVGVGLHSGKKVAINLIPAPKDTGIVFRTGNLNSNIHAHIANVHAGKNQLCSQLTANGTLVSTTEHVMAALVASRINNIYIDFEDSSQASSFELPALDGSSLEYAEGIRRAGIQEQEGAVLHYLRVKRPVQVLMQDKAAWFLPFPTDLSTSPSCLLPPTLQMSVQVNFAHKHLGTTFFRFTLGSDLEATLNTFHREIAPARTFTFENEIDWMHANGLARGGTLDNAIVFSNDEQSTILNEDRLRFPDEWTRHKMLDCIGDLGLAGLPLHGYFFATSPGHALTHELLRELFSCSENFEVR
ncbi:udp-3-o [Plasmopara halstedii]|uniref:UDP-3-O-acyl-N-acetylglucosamine deacetylase n=1 Tax=Plasmopara halstedii TaxID=4781 RepID=A0A0P1B2J8_PLAHL|nr:udp-3-o [Plasmopara halstedii]CEG47645.1 udp-3-o [Plasmopara halstedii]|eukprot:XP_024584014.1 udp-3-o [Plasmopara halstedii]